LLKKDEPKIYLEIKRGEGVFKIKNVQNWQKVRNDELGQLILSTILQQPGTARSSKKKIFADKAIYNRIFRRTHDKETLTDLLKLSSLYDAFIADITLNETASNVAMNGKYSILAIICFIIKTKRKLIDLKLDTGSADWASEITDDNLRGPIFNPNRPDDFEKILKSILNQIIRTLTQLYESRDKLETSVTNFFKTDKKYQSIILERIKMEYFLDEYEFEKISEKFNLVFN
jgi:hypothetical protein